MDKLTENEPGVVWCKPWGEGQGDYVRVNVADFDPEFHQLLDAEPAVRKRRQRAESPE